MEFLGFGGMELLTILLITLIVAGPKRMIEWAYIAGRYLAKLRIVWKQMMESVQQEFDEAGIDMKVPKDIPTRREINRLANDASRPLRESMQRAMSDYEDEVKELKDSVKVTVKDQPSNGARVIGNPPATRTGNRHTKQGFGTWSNGAPGTSASTQGGFGTWSKAGKSEAEGDERG